MTSKKINRGKISEQIKRQTVDICIDDALSGIKRRGKDPEDSQRPLMIHCHLDLIKMSGQYNYKYLQEKLGPLKVDDEFVPDERSPNYRTKLMRSFKEGIYMNIFVNPVENYFPYCYMEIHQKNTLGINKIKRFITCLDRDFPRLNVSGVEYANDIYCLGSDAAMDIYDALQRHYYVPYLREMPEPDSNGKKKKKKKKTNRVCHVGSDKIYERGNNQKKHGEGWSIKYLDRIRIEHTANRQQLINHGIIEIGDLLKNAKFFELNKRAYRFVNFKKSDILPKYYDSYNSNPLYPNSFQAEFIFHRKNETVKNIIQYIADTPHFEELVSTLSDCWVRFDRSWESA